MWARWVAVLVACGCSGGNGAHRPSDARVGDSDGSATGDAMVDADPACAMPNTVPPLHAQLVVDGLEKPVFLTQPIGSTDLYVLEKPGRIRIIRGGAVLPTPFLDITAEMSIPTPDAEGGLLGLAFANDYTTSGRFFVFVTLFNPTNRAAVLEYHRSANPDVATPTPVAELISWHQDGYQGIGGTIEFGSDGALWISSGDTESTPSPATDVTLRQGKILRIDVDHPTVAPAGNLGGNADPFVWDYGLRNPYRMSFDRGTHDLYIGDAADLSWEEIDIEPPGQGNRDYGWDRMEGKHCHDGSSSCGAPGTLPAYERAHDMGYSVIIGGVVYRGSAMPCLRGRYIFGIFAIGHILSFVWDGAQVTSEVELTDMMQAGIGGIVSFGQDRAGEVYMTMLGGQVYELVPN